MNVATYARRNMFRRRGRTIMTMIAVAIAILIFCVIRAAVLGAKVRGEEAARDRLATRQKVSANTPLPRRYVDDIRNIPGVAGATFASWFAAKDPLKRVPFFAAFAVDPESYFEVVDDMAVERSALADWKQTKNGVIIGDVIARQLETGVGKDITLESSIYPGDWKFKVVGIYKPRRKTVDRSTVILRWDFVNDDPRAQRSRDEVGWVMTTVKDPDKVAEMSRAIDEHFEEEEDQTLTMSESAFRLAWLGTFSAVLSALDYVSLFILLIMTLIMGNTIAMSVRERTHEHGVLRAIGFSPGSVAGFIVAETMLVAVVGALIGALLTFLLVNLAIGPTIERQMPVLFPVFRAPPATMMLALAAAAIVGGFAGLFPAIRASRLKVADALRRLD